MQLALCSGPCSLSTRTKVGVGGGRRPVWEEKMPLLVPNTKLAFKARVLPCGFRKQS